MIESRKTVCPIPYLGYCVYERCPFWDDEKRECSGRCFDDYSPLQGGSTGESHSPCTIHWTEDYD